MVGSIPLERRINTVFPAVVFYGGHVGRDVIPTDVRRLS